MTTERRVETLPASGTYTVGPGNLFRLITVTSAVTVNLIQGGTRSVYSGMLALIIKRVESWDKIIITGAAGDTVEFFFGNENITEDVTDVPVTAVQITGTATTAEKPSDTVSDLAPVDIADASAAEIVPASATRRRMRVMAKSDNAGSVFVRTGAAANDIWELAPGTSQAFDTLDQLFARNDTGAVCRVYRFEET